MYFRFFTISSVRPSVCRYCAFLGFVFYCKAPQLLVGVVRCWWPSFGIEINLERKAKKTPNFIFLSYLKNNLVLKGKQGCILSGTEMATHTQQGRTRATRL